MADDKGEFIKAAREIYQLDDTDSESDEEEPTPRIDEQTDNSHNMNMDTSEDKWKPAISSKQIIREMLKPSGNDMVQIGHGYASVPTRILSQINWSSYTAATRKLLAAVFSRRVLATHSLTGKSSPAFPGKPAKKQLDPRLVDDIVQVVVERCGVPASRVRTIITTKCADENKMFRNRQQNIKKEQLIIQNQENVPPSQ
ncbi:protein insensitive-like [Cydia strobilella]|uniref:protein insensitive-like n=1 Tax=Cydia strobilella TaxID=1100964 RepID=UPI00300534A2